MKLLTDFKDRAVSARQALPAFLLVLGLAPWGGIVMAQLDIICRSTGYVNPYNRIRYVW